MFESDAATHTRRDGNHTARRMASRSGTHTVTMATNQSQYIDTPDTSPVAHITVHYLLPAVSATCLIVYGIYRKQLYNDCVNLPPVQHCFINLLIILLAVGAVEAE